MIVPRQIPPPPTLPTDWLPDYQRPAPITYRPRTPRPGTPALGIKTGRPIGGKHTEKRRAQWREAKARAARKSPAKAIHARGKPWRVVYRGQCGYAGRRSA